MAKKPTPKKTEPKKSNPCWKGYAKVKGKANYDKGSCKKK